MRANALTCDQCALSHAVPRSAGMSVFRYMIRLAEPPLWAAARCRGRALSCLAMISVLAARSPGSSFHLALGDMPTWLLAVFAALAFVAAVPAYPEQVKARQALADQLNVQQLALGDQRTARSTLAAH